MSRLRVYVAGPYSASPVRCTREAILAGHALMDAGFVPFVPHLTHYMEHVRSRPYEEWLELDLEWLALCQAVLRLRGISPGADREVERARELGLPIFHSVAQLQHFRPDCPECGQAFFVRGKPGDYVHVCGARVVVAPFGASP